MSGWVTVFSPIIVRGSQWAVVSPLQVRPRNATRLKLAELKQCWFLESAFSPVFLVQLSQNFHRDHLLLPLAAFLAPPRTQLGDKNQNVINHSNFLESMKIDNFTAVNWSGLVWSGLVWSGLVWSGLALYICGKVEEGCKIKILFFPLSWNLTFAFVDSCMKMKWWLHVPVNLPS